MKVLKDATYYSMLSDSKELDGLWGKHSQLEAELKEKKDVLYFMENQSKEDGHLIAQLQLEVNSHKREIWVWMALFIVICLICFCLVHLLKERCL